MYALTGANGHLGRLVIQHLLTQVPAHQIIATTRDPQKLADIETLGVIVRQADFSEPATLPAAFAGATKLLIISTDAVGNRVESHKAAIAAAAVAGVGRIVYTSGPHADPTGSHPIASDHGQTEDELAASGVAWTALRMSFYTDVFKDFIGLSLFNEQLLIPEGLAKHSWLTREDSARAAAGTLLGKLTIDGPVDVTGPEALGFADLAPRLSRIFDRPIVAHLLPDEKIIARIITKGIPAGTAEFLVRLFSWVAKELPTTPTDIVERASGSKPTPVDALFRTLITA